MNVAVATDNPIKIRAVEQAFADAFGKGEVEVQQVTSDLELPEQPIGAAIANGAIQRAKTAQQHADIDFGVGIEAGLMQVPGTDRWISVQICAIADRTGKYSMGMGPGYELPKPILDAVFAGESLRDAFERTLDLEDPERRGAVFFLSDGRVDRMDLTIQAVRMALISYQSMNRL
ncbi:inosine/xanthosine triphosphatase [Candidatus Bipolaricaulota bacterium]|nr:inosine/xanthosine triphosphatase [Candidatus Bipolaricaulota bacterium]